MQTYTLRPLRAFVLDQIRANGIIYFVLNYQGCMSHCRNQQRLWREANNPEQQAAVAQYVDALYDAGDIK
jgi:hypothetical protein